MNNEEYCRFDDQEFDSLGFTDYVTVPQKRAIDALLHSCVVR